MNCIFLTLDLRTVYLWPQTWGLHIFDVRPEDCVFLTSVLRTVYFWCHTWGLRIYDHWLEDCVFKMWVLRTVFFTSVLRVVYLWRILTWGLYSDFRPEECFFFFLSLFWRGRFQVHFIVKAKTLKCSFKIENFMKICYSLIVCKI